MFLTAGSRLGPYEIVSPLGAGGMGEVYRARDTRLERDVAIKVLPAGILSDEASRSRFRKEAKALSRLTHPHVATLLDFGSADGSDYLVMELVPGPTLDEELQKGPLATKDVVRLGAQLARGLKAAHDQGVIHRDLKPSNLCLTGDGLLKILDFGLARIARPASEPPREDTDTDTGLGKVVGSPPYMPPEQVLGKEVDARTDIYSAGAVLYELATGRRPFGQRKGASLTDAILHEAPESPRSLNAAVSPGLEAVMVKALDKDPGLRYQTAGELLVDLERLQQGSEAGASGARGILSGAGHVRGRLDRGRWRLVAGALALLAVALGLAFMNRSLLTKPAPRSGAPRVPTQLTFASGAIMATWSPDASMFAYCSDRSGNTDVWVQQVAGGDPIRITDDPATDCEPAWSPDGTQIAFWSSREGGGLYLVPALGGRARRLGSLGHLPKWSRDGSKLLVVSALYELTYSLHVIDAVRGDAREIALPPGMGSFFSGADWHPDGQRISILGSSKKDGTRMFWTVPLAEGEPVQSEIADPIQRQMRESGVVLISFLWAPSGDALYFQGWAQATTNLWRVRVDPKSLRWLSAPEALTTSQGVLWIFNLSRDGKRLLYSSHTGEPYPLWSLPIDATAGGVRGEGQTVKTFGNWPQIPWLAADGTRLVYESVTQGHVDLREQDLPTGTEHVVATDIEWAVTSADGARIAYSPSRNPGFKVLARASGHEEGIDIELLPSDFSPDGHWLLGTRPEDGRPRKLVLVSSEPAGAANRPERELLTDPKADLWNAQFSPNGRWIAFEACVPASAHCTLRILPSAGGPWRPLIDAAFIARKPRWSPDGRILYFLRLNDELHNVWGLRFDPARGMPVGEPFPVTAFHSMIRHIYGFPNADNFAISKDRLMLPLEDYTNTSIWMLDNVDQ